MKKLMITGTVLALVLATGTIAYATNSNQQTSPTENTKAVSAVTPTVSNPDSESTNNNAETKAVHSKHSATKHNGITGTSETDESNHSGHNTEEENNHSEHSTTEHSSSIAGNDSSENASHTNHSISGHR